MYLSNVDVLSYAYSKMNILKDNKDYALEAIFEVCFKCKYLFLKIHSL